MDQNDYQFMNFIVTHGKEYATLEEYNLRKANYVYMDSEIVKINQSQTTHVAAHNFLSDWTREEYQNLLGLKNMPKPDRSNRPVHKVDESVAAPTSVNWVTAGKVNPVKNQGSCGSCWAFATTASMESAHAIYHSTLPSLSEQ
jgi:C1A family cysteine protease